VRQHVCASDDSPVEVMGSGRESQHTHRERERWPACAYKRAHGTDRIFFRLGWTLTKYIFVCNGQAADASSCNVGSEEEHFYTQTQNLHCGDPPEMSRERSSSAPPRVLHAQCQQYGPQNSLAHISIARGGCVSGQAIDAQELRTASAVHHDTHTVGFVHCSSARANHRIGIIVEPDADADGNFVIESVVPGSVAARTARVHEGDVIEAIDGATVKGVTAQQLKEWVVTEIRKGVVTLSLRKAVRGLYWEHGDILQVCRLKDYIHIYMHTYMYIYIYIYTYICICIYLYIHIFMLVYISIDIYLYIYIYVYTYLYLYINL